MPRILISFLILAGFGAAPAMAYVGPGSSLGVVGVALGLIATLFLTLISFVWYPLKRSWRRLRKLSLRRGGAGAELSKAVARKAGSR